MKIIIVSDTHMPRRAKIMPQRLIEEAQSADLILHAGDWQTMEVYQEFKKLGKVIGVTGNVDTPELGRFLNSKEIIIAGGYRIGLVHGHGSGRSTEKRAKAAFSRDEVDCIIFGHSHIPLLKTEDGLLMFNPGSATDKRRQKQYSFGILRLGDKADFAHVFYSDKD
ncbi:metallophosphoesterase family protein [Mesobacillus foraminis]|nr:metallophosphoesterase family protein [Mesobacillus foraminis]